MRAGRVDRPRRLLLPAVLVDDLTQRPPPHRSVASRWPAERDRGVDGHALGDADQLAQLVLDLPMPSGDDAAVAQRPRRQQQVLHRRVHRASLGGCGPAVPHQARQDHNRRFLEVVDEVLHGPGHASFGRVVVGAGALGVAVAGALRIPALAEAPAQQRLGLDRHRAVPQHHEAEHLPVRAARGPAGMPQDRRQILVPDGIGQVAPDCARGGEAFEQSQRPRAGRIVRPDCSR